ncbi:ABC transporter substrate-binding protein [Brevibacterium samyangense]|uniref:ABC transporter substrate-binding protein n=1 Tax=Brevibacterium samyangense TaxID=366888 RepID=A0ABN2TD77_9MICO
MSKRILTLTTAALAVLGLTLAACSGGGSGSGGGTITIGYSGPLSGGAAAYGQNALDGLEMAVQTINEQGVTVNGESYTVEVASLDDQYLPNNAATNAQRLVEQDDASVVFIPHSGGILAAQQLNAGRTPFVIGAYSSDPAILETGNELSVMIPPNFESYATPFVQETMSRYGKKLGLIGTQSEYGQNWASLVTEEWGAQGGEVLTNNGVDYSTVTDFASTVSKALAEQPDVIFVGGPSQPTALVIAEARKQGFEGGFIVMDQAKFEEMELITDPANLVGSVGVRPLRDGDDPGVADFVERYTAEITDERPATSEVGYHFQTLAIMVKAMEVAGTTDDPAAIHDAVQEALGQVDDVFKVSQFPDRMTEGGHLIADDLLAVYVDEGNALTTFPIPQSEE